MPEYYECLCGEHDGWSIVPQELICNHCLRRYTFIGMPQPNDFNSMRENNLLNKPSKKPESVNMMENSLADIHAQQRSGGEID